MAWKGAAGLLLLLTQQFWNVGAFYDPHCDGKQVIVHLFEWKWTDIALECERFLAPAKYCGVQVSPPNEHVVLPGDKYPWWQRYQPVSYKLDSRSGTRAEFVDMVERCNAVGVRIFVDTVINHMAGMGREGVGSGGSQFNTMDEAHDFPAVPYTDKDFTPRSMCPSGCGCVDNYADPNIVRNCYLVGLSDLYGATDYVRDKVAGYLNDLIDIGVAGFRVDAAKHMWPEDIAAIQGRLHDLSTKHGFKAGSKPFFAHEVIDRNDGAVLVSEYYDLGWVTEFRYCQKVSEATFQDWGTFLNLYVPDWGMGLPDRAFVFVDNHDNQRGHGGAGGVVTHKDGNSYVHAVSFTLAQDYGFTRIMSSYYFEENTDRGPPYYEDGYYSTADVVINPDNSCGGGWVCEHRWNAIHKMAEFRNAVAGTKMVEKWSEGDALGIAREGKGFFAMTKRSGGFSKTVQTTMPAGEYCNIIDSCSTKVTVGGDGTASININNDEGVLAICVGCLGEDVPVVTATPGTPTAPTAAGDTTTTKATTTTTEKTTSQQGGTTGGTTTATTTTSTSTTTPGSGTTANPPATCCKRVEFASSGMVGSSKGEYLGRYYYATTDATGRAVYQHEKGAPFIHYIDDPLHRLKAWAISMDKTDLTSDVLSEGEETCADSDNQKWEVFTGTSWEADPTAKVSCGEASAGCCNGLQLQSTGAIATHFPDLLDTYRQEGLVNGKPSYSNGKHRVFFYEDNLHHLFGWTVTDAGSVQLGPIVSEGKEDCAEDTGNTWEYLLDQATEWASDTTFYASCHLFSDCCDTLTLASTGLAATLFPDLLGDYRKTAETGGVPVYTGASGAKLMYKDDLLHKWSGWVVTSGGDGLGSIAQEGGDSCPTNLGSGWEVWQNGGWSLDLALSLYCKF